VGKGVPSYRQYLVSAAEPASRPAAVVAEAALVTAAAVATLATEAPADRTMVGPAGLQQRAAVEVPEDEHHWARQTPHLGAMVVLEHNGSHGRR